MAPHSPRLPIAALSLLLLGCATSGAPQPAAPAIGASTPPPVSSTASAWPKGATCQQKLARILDAKAAGGLPADFSGAPVSLVVIGGDGQPIAGPDAPVSAPGDLPLPRDLGAHSAGCTLVVRALGPAEAGERRTLGERTVASTYVDRVETRRNPAYVAAKSRLTAAETDSRRNGVRWLATGEPSYDLIGLVVGTVLDQFGGSASTARDALEQVKATPPTIEMPVYKPYTYRRTTVATNRTTRFGTALLDSDAGQAWITSTRIDEEREFEIADGLSEHDRDREASAGDTTTFARVAAWEREVPAPDVAALARRLLATAGEPVAAEDGFGTILEVWEHAGSAEAAERPAERPAAKASVPRGGIVRIGRGDDAGYGFYVGPNAVVTTAMSVRDDTIVDVIDANGKMMFGLVQRRDDILDLALLKVGREGKVLALAPVDGAIIGAMVEAPRLGDAYLRGKLKGLSRARPNDGATREVGYIETDIDLPPGQTGRPILGPKGVLGIDTGAGTGKLGYRRALDADEVQHFLGQDDRS